MAKSGAESPTDMGADRGECSQRILLSSNDRLARRLQIRPFLGGLLRRWGAQLSHVDSTAGSGGSDIASVIEVLVPHPLTKLVDPHL